MPDVQPIQLFRGRMAPCVLQQPSLRASGVPCSSKIVGLVRPRLLKAQQEMQEHHVTQKLAAEKVGCISTVSSREGASLD